MPDKEIEPEDPRRKRILQRIQTHKHDVLMTSEIAAGVPEVSQKQIGRNLEWMKNHGVIESRQAGENDIWLWWVSGEELSAEESVATAQQIGTLFKELYDNRWEFRLMGVGAVMLLYLLPLSISAMISIVTGVDLVSNRAIVNSLLVGFVTAVLVIFIGLFLFPIETLGNWPPAVDSSDSE